MKIYYGGRRAGKTTRLIQEAAKKHSYIVCLHQEEANRIFRQAIDMGLDIPFPLTFDELENGQFHPGGVKSLMMDNADYFFDRWMARLSKGCKWEAITTSNNFFGNEVEKIEL